MKRTLEERVWILIDDSGGEKAGGEKGFLRPLFSLVTSFINVGYCRKTNQEGSE